MAIDKHVLFSFSILNNIVCLYSSLSMKISREPKEYVVQNRVLATILQDCDLGLKNIGIYDHNNDSSTFDMISSLWPSFTSLLASRLEAVEDPLKRQNTEFQGIIIVENISVKYERPFDRWNNLLQVIIQEWTLKQNGSIFVIPRPNDACASPKFSFLLLKQFYVSNVYYICLLDDQPLIYAYDPYGNTRSLFWKEISRGIDFGNRWAVYKRLFEPDRICQGFSLNQEYSIKTTNITIGITNNNIQASHSLKGNKLYKETTDKCIFKSVSRELIEGLKSLLGIKINYYYTARQSDESLRKINSNTPVDFLLYWLVAKIENPWVMTPPVYYDENTIISHHQGYKEPVEKIRDFYGHWTLISLSIILTLTFIVIWFKMKKKTSFAFFNILRLLINGSVYVPIDTLSLRIFFAMIFLYFLVIQATFSGHLAEFLTKFQLRKNVDSLEDLKDPRIETIYNFGYTYDKSSDESLLSKTIYVKSMENCLQLMEKNQNSVCIGTMMQSLSFLQCHSSKDKYYMSKNRFTLAPIVMPLRNRFPLNEQLTWALLYLMEIKITFHATLMKQKRIISVLRRREANRQVKFRPIKLEDLRFAFILLGIGNSLGCICFFFEISMRKNKSRMSDTF